MLQSPKKKEKKDLSGNVFNSNLKVSVYFLRSVVSFLNNILNIVSTKLLHKIEKKI